MHGSGCEGECAGEYRCVAVLQGVRAELRVGQVVGVHPLDFWSHVWAVVWSVACQLQILVADNLLRDVDVGLIWWAGMHRHYWISSGNNTKRNIICLLRCSSRLKKINLKKGVTCWISFPGRPPKMSMFIDMGMRLNNQVFYTLKRLYNNKYNIK